MRRVQHAETGVSRQGGIRPAAEERADWQRQRTRDMLVAAAEDLVGEGVRLTVPTVAARAGVSRATAYRYFPTAEALVVELSLRGAQGALAEVDFGELSGLPLPDATERLVRHLAHWAFDNEAGLRHVLWASLLPDSPTPRPGHRRHWIRELLEPVREQLDPVDHRRLSAALTLLFGVDPVVCLRDIAGLDRDEAVETLVWAGRRLTAGLVLDR